MPFVSDEELTEELESLLAIFPDDLVIKYTEFGVSVYATIFPECADIAEGFVQGEIEFVLDEKYIEEHKISKIVVTKSRGLGLQTIQDITSKLYEEAAIYEPPMIFQLITAAEDIIRDIQIPTLPCPICMCDFSTETPFMKTKCFHIFHNHCFAMWYAIKVEDYRIELAENASRNVYGKSKAQGCWCPVCREKVDETDVQEFLPLVEAKLREYRNSLLLKSQEQQRLQAQWKELRNSEAEEDGDSVQLASTEDLAPLCD